MTQACSAMASCSDVPPLSDATPLKRRGVSAASGSTWTGTGSGTRSYSSPASSRTSCSAPQARTPDFAHLSPGDTGEHMTSLPCTRVRSSSQLNTRRCLVKQLGEAQAARPTTRRMTSCCVFNMAGDSADEDDSAMNLWGVPADAAEKSGLTSCLSTELLSPMPSDGKSLPSTRHSDTGDSELQCDAWMEGDWLSPSSAQACVSTSPCNAALALDRQQRQVADAVLSELQIDLESQVQRAVHQMSSWISEEVTFSRQGFEESMRTVSDSWAAERVNMQSTHTQLTSRIEQLQASLQEQILVAQKLQEKVGSGSRQRASTEPQPSVQPSVVVLEAQRVGEDRKWRVKFDEFQTGLDRQLERIESLDKQSSHIMDRVSGQDALIAVSASTVQVEIVGKGTEDLATQLRIMEEKSAEQAMKMAEKLALHEATMKGSTIAIHNLEESLDKQASDLTNRVIAHDAYFQNSATEMQSMKETFGNEAADLAERVAVNGANIKDNATQIHNLQETLGNETTYLAHKVVVHDIILNENAVQICGMGERLAMETSAIALAHDTHVKATGEQIQRVLKTLGNETTHLAKKITAHDTSIKDTTKQIHNLEDAFGKAVKYIADKVAVHDIILHESASQIHALEEAIVQEACQIAERLLVHDLHIKNASAQTKDLAEQIVVHDVSMKDNAVQIQKLKGSADVLQQFKAQLTKAQTERLAELQVVCGKLEEHEKQLLRLPAAFHGKLVSFEEAVRKAIADLSGDLRHAQAELSQQLESKAHQSEIHECRADMQAWVEQVRSSHELMVDQVGRSLEVAAASNLEQAATIHRHEEWQKEVCAWLEQSQEREQGLSHIVYRICEDDFAELLHLFQEIGEHHTNSNPFFSDSFN